MDLRSLALFRLCLGLLVCFDALAHLGSVSALYGPQGLLPLSLLDSASDSAWRWSLHAVNSSSAFQVLLIVLQALAGLALAGGYRTRLANLIAWVLAVSLINRNPLIVDSGDLLIAALLFWALFLPLSARWSLDASLAEPGAGDIEPSERSWASAALIVQIGSVFVFTALHRNGESWNGAALQQLFALDAFSHGIGPWLATQAALCAGLTRWSQWIQLLGPVLILLLRLAPRTSSALATATAALSALVLLQLALLQLLLLSSAGLGLLPWATLVALTALIGPAFWQRLGRKNLEAARPRLFYPDDRPQVRTAARLVLGILLVDAELAPARTNRRAESLARANGSWVLFDRDDSAHLRGAALLRLLRQSPMTAVLGRWLERPFFARIADRIYAGMTNPRWRLPAPSTGVTAPTSNNSRWIGVATLVVLSWNLLGLSASAPGLQAVLAPPLQLLRLDQRWDSLGPQPPADSRYWLATGNLASGQDVPVLEPERQSGTRWRLYEQRAAGHNVSADNKRLLLDTWSERTCRHWNARHPAAERLTSIRLLERIEAPAANQGAGRTEQRVLHRHECAGPAP